MNLQVHLTDKHKYGYEIFSPKPKLKDEWINHIGDSKYGKINIGIMLNEEML